MVTLLLVRNTVDGCQATNTITDTGIPRSRESGGLFIYLNCFYLFDCLFVFYNWLFCCFLSFITFMSFAFSYPIIFCAYRLSTSMPRYNRCSLPGIKFRKTYVRTCFELTLTCLVLERWIFSRKNRCILWPFKLTSDLFLLVNNMRNWRILRLH